MYRLAQPHDATTLGNLCAAIAALPANRQPCLLRIRRGSTVVMDLYNPHSAAKVLDPGLQGLVKGKWVFRSVMEIENDLHAALQGVRGGAWPAEGVDPLPQPAGRQRDTAPVPA